MEEYFKVLGLTSSASLKEVKKAYRKLALKLHPDRNKAQNARDQFIALEEAYTIIVDVLTGKRFAPIATPYYEPVKNTEEEQRRNRKKNRKIADLTEAYFTEKRILQQYESFSYFGMAISGMVLSVIIVLLILVLFSFNVPLAIIVPLLILLPIILTILLSKIVFKNFQIKHKTAYKEYKEKLRNVENMF